MSGNDENQPTAEMAIRHAEVWGGVRDLRKHSDVQHYAVFLSRPKARCPPFSALGVSVAEHAFTVYECGSGPVSAADVHLGHVPSFGRHWSLLCQHCGARLRVEFRLAGIVSTSTFLLKDVLVAPGTATRVMVNSDGSIECT